MSVTILTMTMGAGKGIPGSTIRYALRHNFSQFERVIVVDGALDEESKEFYGQFKNVQVIDSPWTDSYVSQYQKAIDELKDGDWAIWLDDDEILSEELKKALLDEKSFEFLGRHVDVIKLPCVLHLTDDGNSYYAAEPEPKKVYKNQWTKNIVFKKNEGLWLRHFGSHVIPENKSGRYQYLEFPYFHMKSLESFVYNDVWQAFLSPPGQSYSPEETVKFKMFTACYKSTKEFKTATRKGTWPPTLKKFAWDHRAEYNRPISRLAWVYWILEGHLMPHKDDSMLWSNVKHHVLSPETMAIYEENKAQNKGIIIE
jgi:glycosyltransferase involved in cell wall biosynthesis